MINQYLKLGIVDLHNSIEQLNDMDAVELNDFEYSLYWDELNNLYKYYIILLGDNPLSILAKSVGDECGYYYNKYSKSLFKIVDCIGFKDLGDV